jgi:hypothetical protein
MWLNRKADCCRDLAAAPQVAIDRIGCRATKRLLQGFDADTVRCQQHTAGQHKEQATTNISKQKQQQQQLPRGGRGGGAATHRHSGLDSGGDDLQTDTELDRSDLSMGLCAGIG